MVVRVNHFDIRIRFEISQHNYRPCYWNVGKTNQIVKIFNCFSGSYSTSRSWQIYIVVEAKKINIIVNEQWIFSFSQRGKIVFVYKKKTLYKEKFLMKIDSNDKNCQLEQIFKCIHYPFYHIFYWSMTGVFRWTPREGFQFPLNSFCLVVRLEFNVLDHNFHCTFANFLSTSIWPYSPNGLPFFWNNRVVLCYIKKKTHIIFWDDPYFFYTAYIT